MENKDQILMEQVYAKIENESVTEGIFDRFTSGVKSGIGQVGAIAKGVGQLAQGKAVKGDSVLKAKLEPKLKTFVSDFMNDLNKGIGSDYEFQIGKIYPEVATALKDLHDQLKKSGLA